MKKLFLMVLVSCMALFANAETRKVSSPDGKLVVTLNADGGKLTYEASYDGKVLVTKSALGLKTDMGDYTQGLKLLNAAEGKKQELNELSELVLAPMPENCLFCVSYGTDTGQIRATNEDSFFVDGRARIRSINSSCK